MFPSTLQRHGLKLTLSAALLAATAGLAFSQAAAPVAPAVTTTRYRETAAPAFPAEKMQAIELSRQPRYYLDTIDQLNRVTSDATRTAPGLAKNNYVGKVYEVHNVEAIELQTYLVRILAYEGGTAEIMAQDGVVGKAGKATQYLFVTAPDFQIPGIDEIIEKCDVKGFKSNGAFGKDFGGGAGSVQYIGKHRTASELISILRGTELGNIGAFYAPPFADDSTNSIYINDNPSDQADNLAALKMFDKPPLQLELEVSIYEIENGDIGKLGLDWDAWKRYATGNITMTGGPDPKFGEVVPTRGSNTTWSSLLSIDARWLADFLNYTVQTGNSKVVTSTKVTMVNSEDTPGAVSGGGARGLSTAGPAVIESVTVYPYTVVGSADAATNSLNGRNEVVTTNPGAVKNDAWSAFEGVRVEIRPFIAAESITLKVNVTVNSLVGFSPATDAPIISSRQISSVLNTVDGKPLVIGGLDKQTLVESRVGIPGLKDIPVLQYLFSKESKNASTSKILIALRPKLVKGSDGIDVPADVK